jgi:MFS family permease
MPRRSKEYVSDPEKRSRWLAFAGVIAGVSVFGVAQGLTYPLLSFILIEKGISPTLIGLSTAMTPLGLIASASIVPRAAVRLGATTLALLAVCAAIASLTVIGLLQSVWAWFPLRFLLGVAINPLFILSEAWMISLVAPARRGRAMGIYAAILSAGYAAGPFTLVLTGETGLRPFMVAIAACVMCGTCLLLVRRRLPGLTHGGPRLPISRFVALAPALLVAVFLTAAFEQAYMSLFPVYGVNVGLDEAETAGLLSVLIVGNVALQVPLGFAAERLRPRSVLVACVALAALCCLLQPIISGTPGIWLLAFFLGAFSYGAYTVALVELGERFSGPALVTGNAAFALLWGIGSLAGPLATGPIMDFAGPQGLPLTFGLLLLGYALRCSWTLFSSSHTGIPHQRVHLSAAEKASVRRVCRKLRRARLFSELLAQSNLHPRGCNGTRT